MRYHQMILLKNGKEAFLRNAEASDGAAVLENFNLTHEETDFLLSYPDENSFDVIQESNFLAKKAESDACIKCAREAGYQQLELDVVADNERAISMYKKAGFIEYGRNPLGFCSRTSGFQELILMRKEL